MQNIFIFCDISLLHYFNLSSSIISCLSSGCTYISLGISLSCSFVTVSEFFSTFCNSISNFIINQINDIYVT